MNGYVEKLLTGELNRLFNLRKDAKNRLEVLKESMADTRTRINELTGRIDEINKALEVE